jgi:FAD/FMN-containing dehydrogenase
MMAGDYRSFGRVRPATPSVMEPSEAIAMLKTGNAGKGSLLAFGNGRSYGDSCQNMSGAIVDMRAMGRILSFDPQTGIIEAESGTLLCNIIAHAAPFGFFPAVVPGTQFVTLGGAIANDVHGKNHHRRGTFGCHVESFVLLRSDGRRHVCSASRNGALFRATIGGMGLTGLILSASIRLMRVPSLDIAEKATPFRGLREFFDIAEQADATNEYAVAWIDQLSASGRGILLTGNHAEFGAHTATRSGGRLSVPIQPPFTVLNRPFLRVFNSAYQWKKCREKNVRHTGYRSFFFPLDGMRNWNRLYGPKGLFQHQSVMPPEGASGVVEALLATARRSGQGSFLTVLKRFGAVKSPGLLSFPRAGYTLTLDFPNRGEKTLSLLRLLDRIAIDAGGAVNPYKDTRMEANVFRASFPNWRQLDVCRDPAFMSDFWRRTAGSLRPNNENSMQAAE